MVPDGLTAYTVVVRLRGESGLQAAPQQKESVKVPPKEQTSASDEPPVATVPAHQAPSERASASVKIGLPKRPTLPAYGNPNA